ncbi:type VII secretion protein EsaA [Virgibacillus sp. W0181]|uniref:type VII secretion protein EsaA n=1 Tax=Virgibacillus sp. W0181 TaxID=3391581 RepID=UPI003F468D0E
MNQGLPSSLALIVKVLVILSIPLLMFRYVDSQPVVKTSEPEETATRSIAIVNEDVGVEEDDEPVIIGKEVASLLNDQADYKWTVISRSAAEHGFADEKYDAILYVPSDFSKDVMSFKEDSPNKASIDYVIQPNLEAKNRQRVHKEMALAKK